MPDEIEYQETLEQAPDSKNGDDEDLDVGPIEGLDENGEADLMQVEFEDDSVMTFGTHRGRACRSWR